MAYKNLKNIIINTSLKLFSEKGYDNVSVNEICSTCTITKPTFYYHFKAKEDVIFAHFNNILKSVADKLQTIDANTSGHDILITTFNLIFEAFTAPGYDFVQTLISGSLKNIEKNLYFPESLEKHIVLCIKKGQKDGSIANATEPETLFNSCYHMFMGYLLFWCQHHGFTNEFHSLSDSLLPLI